MWHNLWSKRNLDAEEDKTIHPINFDPTLPDPIIPKWLTGVDRKQLVDLQTETGIARSTPASGEWTCDGNRPWSSKGGSATD